MKLLMAPPDLHPISAVVVLAEEHPSSNLGCSHSTHLHPPCWQSQHCWVNLSCGLPREASKTLKAAQNLGSLWYCCNIMYSFVFNFIKLTRLNFPCWVVCLTMNLFFKIFFLFFGKCIPLRGSYFPAGEEGKSCLFAPVVLSHAWEATVPAKRDPYIGWGRLQGSKRPILSLFWLSWCCEEQSNSFCAVRNSLQLRECNQVKLRRHSTPRTVASVTIPLPSISSCKKRLKKYTSACSGWLVLMEGENPWMPLISSKPKWRYKAKVFRQDVEPQDISITSYMMGILLSYLS